MRIKVALLLFLPLMACCFVSVLGGSPGEYYSTPAAKNEETGRNQSRPNVSAAKPPFVAPQLIVPANRAYLNERVVEGEVLVRFRGDVPAASRAEIHRMAGAEPIAYLPALHLCRVKVEEDVSGALRRYRAQSEVESAEPNYISRVCLTPDDPLMPLQWSLMQVEGPSAWDVWKGRSTTVVAIVDSGVDLDHPDLAGKIWRNPAEILNGLDDDHNGFVDDIFGWDFVHSNPDPDPDPDGVDNDGDGYIDGGALHGTAVAGIAAATTDNGLGVAGLGWRISLMAIQTHDDEGLATYFNLVSGIVYAVDMGAAVINLSTAGPFSDIIQSAVDYAHSHGAMVVAAAGNSAADLDNQPVSPICNDGSANEVVGVAATSVGDRLGDYSNYGSGNVDLSAPGTEILSTVLINHTYGFDAEYGYLTGTSMAAPLVSALAALAKSANPTLSNDQIRDVLQATADSIDGINSAFAGQMGAGRINARKAIQSLVSGDRIPPEPPSNLVAADLGSGGAISLTWTASPSPDVAGYVLYQGTQPGSYTGAIDVGNLTSYHAQHLTDGTNYYFALSAYDSSVPPNEGLLSSSAQATPSSTQYLSLGAGLNLFSLRLDLLPGSDTPEALFGSVPFALYAWDTPSGRYRTYPNPSVQWLQRNRGYWTSLGQPIEAQARGAALDEASPVAIPLGAGWNLIGSPFAAPLSWDPEAIQVETSVTKTLAQAAQDGEVADYAWTFLNGGYAPVTNVPLPGALSRLEPGRGYWLLAHQAATMLLPPPVLRVAGVGAQFIAPAAPDAGVMNHAPTRHDRGLGMYGNRPLLLEVRAEASRSDQGANRDRVIVGRAERAISLVNPPAPSGAMDLAIVGFGGVAFLPLAYDLRRELPPDAEWDIAVSGAPAGTQVSITWPDLRSLPLSLSPALIDLDCQQAVLMRTNTAYNFRSDGEERHFRLMLSQATSLVPPVVAVEPLRGARGIRIVFSLPAPGQVEVEILSLTGITVWKSAARLAVKGLDSLPWDGLSVEGSLAPSGYYLCLLHVAYEDGEKASAVRSFVLR